MNLLRPLKCVNFNQKYFKTLSSAEVRSVFFNFFLANGHTFVPSSSVVSKDPSLLFVNSGMNQFKSIFLGIEPTDSEFFKLKRAVNSQKCIRAGGKHNDFEDVGRDLTHHTFFEMLGNWSFGDYSKAEACRFAWNFLTEILALPPQRLYITYFAGDDNMGLQADNECRSIWENIGVPKDHILPFDRRSNFWEMAEFGPCGPCSEIHIDLEGISDAVKAVNVDGSPVVELWNLVFLQFNREECDSFKPLPKFFVDCGMGFERLTAVMQKVKSSYDTDIFQQLLLEISKRCKAGIYRGRVGSQDDGLKDTAFRIVADHLRASCILIADGVVPFEKDQGYILRMLLRRAARVSWKYLNGDRGIIADILPSFINNLKTTFPEVGSNEDRIKDTVRNEEELFWRTVDRGEIHFKKMTSKLKSGDIIPGVLLWNLHDTYGLNIDMSTMLAEERCLVIDKEGFEECREKYKICANAASKGILKNCAKILVQSKIEPSNDCQKYSFHRKSNGEYVFPIVTSNIQALFTDNGSPVDRLSKNETGFVIFQNTIFYSEQGGQICDIGMLKTVSEETAFLVTNVQRSKNFVFLFGKCLMDIEKGEALNQQIDEIRRLSLMRNHTATHLLGYALNEICGTVIEKSGSLISDEGFHYDCLLDHKLTLKELEGVESFVRRMITEKTDVYTEEDSSEKVRMNFRGTDPDYLQKDVYGKVRLVRLGSETSPLVEFCCGTHLHNVGDLEAFALIADKSQRGGVRRLYGLSGSAARSAWNLAYEYENQLAQWDSNILESSLRQFERAFFSSILPLVKKLELKKIFKRRKRELVKMKRKNAVDT